VLCNLLFNELKQVELNNAFDRKNILSNWRFVVKLNMTSNH